MNKNLIKDQNQQSLTINKKSSVQILSLIICFANWDIWGSTIQLDAGNFYQYLNADHPVKGHYELISDIDLSRFIPWKPVGNTSTPFSLTLYGNGHVISGLDVSASADDTASGLFGSLQDSTIRQILLNRPKVTSAGGSSPTGALVGELKSGRIEEVVNSAGSIRTTGFRSHAGGIAGSVSDSAIRNSVNTGTVITIRGASAGGIAGLAAQKSSISNDLNTGKITSKHPHFSPAGGIVGTLKSNSIANNNINTGEVRVSYTQDSGGVAGEAQAAKVLNNLNTGYISVDSSSSSRRRGGNRGGLVGRAFEQTRVSKNLNTGSIYSKQYHANAGGIAGQGLNARVVQNVNAGTVHHAVGQEAYTGGIIGEAEGGSLQNNLNIGSVEANSTRAHVGGISGAATRWASVFNNVNTGPVEARGDYSHLSGAVAKVMMAGRIEKNLDTFTKHPSSNETADGRDSGIIRLSKGALKSDLNGLSGKLWNTGNSSQLPMLKGINIPYRELARISGSKQKNNPPVSLLKEFSDPGGALNATSFDRTIWNGRDGYLPFPKIFSKPQILLAGIDCTRGGFDCNDGKDIKPTLLTSPSSSAQPSTRELTTTSTPSTLSSSESPSEASTTIPSSSQPSTNARTTVSIPPTTRSSESPSEASATIRSSSAQPSTSELTTTSIPDTSMGSELPSEAIPEDNYSSSYTHQPQSTASTARSTNLPDNCPPPEGNPLFQAYDPTKQRLYVVIQPESLSEEIILARYKGSELDRQFGLCGIMTYTASGNIPNILDAYQSLAGQVIHENTGSHLDIVATNPSEKTVLLKFPLSATQGYQARFSVHNDIFPENIQIDDTAYHKGVMYLTGTINNRAFICRYHQRGLLLSKSIDRQDKERVVRLKISPDGERLYLTGTSHEDAPYPLFIKQYDSKRLTLAASFGNIGKEQLFNTDIDTVNSQQDILMQKEHIYIAVFSPEEEKLSIRRFATDNGQMDSAFIIDDRIVFSSRSSGSSATVRLMKTGDYLHAIIYNSNGQLLVVTYENQVHIHRFETAFKPPAAKSTRPVFTGNNAYLASGHTDIEKGSRYVKMQEISLNLEKYQQKKSPTTLSFGDPSAGSSMNRLSLGIGLIAASTVVIAATAVMVAIFKFKKQPTVSGRDAL